MKTFKAILVIVISFFIFTGCSNKNKDGFVSIFDGKTFTGWKVPEGDNGHWKIIDGVIDYDGKSESPSADKNLWTEKEYGDFVLMVDWRLTREPVEEEVPVVLPDGTYDLNEDGSQKEIKVMDAGDSGIYLRGTSKCQLNIWSWPIGSGEVYGYRTDSSMPPEVIKGVTPLINADNPPGEWNTFKATMKGEYLTVELNGKLVIDKALLPGVPLTGPVALQHHTDPVQFRNILIKELK